VQVTLASHECVSFKVSRKSYNELHYVLRSRYGQAYLQLCEGGCQSRAEDWAYVHGTRSTFVTLCHRCHMLYDHQVCPRGHDTRRFGRRSDGGCGACSRISSAKANGQKAPCQACGYSPCRCV